MSSYWRVAGLNYLKYLQVCNATVRNALKEPLRTSAEARGAVHFREQAISQGKRGPRYVSFFLLCIYIYVIHVFLIYLKFSNLLFFSFLFIFFFFLSLSVVVENLSDLFSSCRSVVENYAQKPFAEGLSGA